ncbi:PNGase F N-terminal domain-containing protein [Myroides injenensis]|uniref:PNGase F N-terminal domain-containing protein n=1 Tax=Myroides injenensis TaxID=1183151 RepID=UPI000287F81B|nr:PNGase F N-terminal domain-containing protein [Myroides injenensis]
MKAKTLLLNLYLILFSIISNAQKPNHTTLIEYDAYVNNELVTTNNATLLVLMTKEYLKLNQQDLIAGKLKYPIEQTFVDLKNDKHYSIAQLNKAKRIKTEYTPPVYNYEILNETKEILGYICNKATTVINSNKYTIWYTKQLASKGSPNNIGSDLGVVLEIDRNGTFKTVARKINTNATFNIKEVVQLNESTLVNKNDYDKLLWESKFTTLNIFKDELINYNAEHKTEDNIYRYAEGTLIVKKVKFPIITSGDQVFLNLTQQSNGDAYDRTGSVFLIPNYHEISFYDALKDGVNILPKYIGGNEKEYQGVIATDNYTPPIELMRFFTSFGIGAYNHINFLEKDWQKQTTYRQEITEFAPLLNNSEWLVGIYIGNYDKGGHKVSLDVTIHPSESTPKQVKNIMSLFNTINLLEMAGQSYPTMFSSPQGVTVNFTLTEPLKNARLRYTATGHGGWENGDEFNPKINSIILDQKKVTDFYPWRQDCGSYRDYNPASGNFNNGLSSSDLSRSNWCPGSVTSPIWVSLGDLKAGTHNIQVQIPMGQPEGTSFSYWNISGVLFGE